MLINNKPSITDEHWLALSKYNDTIRQALDIVSPLGERAVNEFRIQYCKINNEDKAIEIANRILALWKNEYPPHIIPPLASSFVEQIGSHGRELCENPLTFINSDVVMTLVGANTHIYRNKWTKLIGAEPNKWPKDTDFGWNWSALLLGPIWFSYRKMYYVASCFWAGIIALDIWSLYSSRRYVEYVYLVGFLLCNFIIPAIVADASYLIHIKTKFCYACDKYPVATERDTYLRAIGGVSWFACILSILIFILESYIYGLYSP